MSASLPRSLVRDLTRVVGRGGLITDPARLLAYESDGLTAYRRTPRAVVLPRDTGEAAEVVATLVGAGVAVVPRGSGTGLSGGAVASEDGVVVGTSRMDRILEVDPDNRLARVQPGVINADLTEAARPHGLYYAPDPSSQSACTMGGNVAENSGGPHCLKYGVTTRYVSGVTLVLPDGEAVELGGAARSDRGYDLVGLVVGSEGCFGLVTEIEVGLLPLPEGVRTLMAVFDDLEAAGRAVTDIIASGLLPAALEIIDGETIRAVEESVFAAGYPVGAGAVLVAEFDGTVAGLGEDVEAALASCREAGAREVRRARSEEEREALWRGRKKAFGAMGRIAPDLMVQDATVPRTRLPDVLRRIDGIGRRYDLTVANVFHAGDGNLHPNILFDRRDPDELARVEKASREIMEVCVEAGGTVTGEHGVGLDKRRYMELIHSPEELRAMADVKRVFDPRGCFNPGKVLPDEAWEEDAGAPAERTTEEEALVPARARDSRGGRPESGAYVAERLTEIVGAEGILVGTEASPWSAEGSDPVPVALPRSTDEVAAVVGVAREAGWRVRPDGGGRGRASRGAGANDSFDLVVSLIAMDAVLEYEPADLTLTAQAGVTLAELGRLTAEHGQWLPLDPPGPDDATLGAVLARGTGGSLATAFGAPRDLTLGLTLVTGDGRVLRLGGRVVKNVAGFDVVKAVVGSRGRLGIVTEASVRLYPFPAVDRLLVARAAGPEELVEGARAVATAPVVPAAVELGRLPDAGDGALLAVRLVGSAATVEAESEVLVERMPDLQLLDETEAVDVRERLRRVGPVAPLAFRLTAPPADLGELVDAVGSLDSTGPWVADVAAGVLRGAVEDLYAGAGADDSSGAGAGASATGAPVRAWARPLEVLRERVEALGGGLTLTAGPPELVREIGGPGVGGRSREVAARLEEGLERCFDPDAVLSPGAWVPTGAATGSGGEEADSTGPGVREAP